MGQGCDVEDRYCASTNPRQSMNGYYDSAATSRMLELYSSTIKSIISLQFKPFPGTGIAESHSQFVVCLEHTVLALLYINPPNTYPERHVSQVTSMLTRSVARTCDPLSVFHVMEPFSK